MAGKKEKMRERLIGLSDPEYKEFNDRILNAPSVKTLGIRVPVLRKLAKETAKEMQKEDGWLYEMTRTKGHLSGGAYALWDGGRIPESVPGRESAVSGRMGTWDLLLG